MKIFVCEFVTGGGLYRAPLPPSLVQEGEYMLHALLDDLLQIPDMEVIVSRDPRLPALTHNVEIVTVTPEQDVWQCWAACLQQADACWPIAPETGGLLERLSALTVNSDRLLLGSTPQAVALAASKYRTSALLAAAGVPTVPTLPAACTAFDEIPGPWVAKPDDGVSCEDSGFFDDRFALRAWLAQGRMPTHVVQPYLTGVAASISMLCKGGRAWLLSCNRQLVFLEDGGFRYGGSVLNAMAASWEGFARIAAEVAAAMPGLAGYAGVDVVVDGENIHVLEVNPRLTTSYAGLRAATGLNTARLVIDLLYNADFQIPTDFAKNIVEIRLHE